MIYFIGESRLVNSENFQQSTIEDCLIYFKNKLSIAVDTETEGMDCHSKRIISLQLGNTDNQWVIDCRVIDILRFKDLLESKLLLFHNAKFDLKFLKRYNINPEKIWDTMLAEGVLNCGRENVGYGLKDLTKRYLGVELDKTTRGDFHKLKSEPFNDKQIQYAALDVAYLHNIGKLQWANIVKYGLQYAINLENQVVRVLADIEFNGVYLDREQWRTNAVDYKTQQDLVRKQLDECILGDSNLSAFFKPRYSQTNLFDFEERILNINYDSPTQVMKVFKALGISVESTGDRELRKLVNKHKFFELLDKYREVSKIISTYGIGFLDNINKTTGRVHTSFWQILNTFRLSSNEPNLQNIPRDNKFRNCFKPREGYSWISIDYSGQELRLMADFSGEKGFIDVLNSGEDLHCYAGSMMFRRQITKADKEDRTKAKTINFMKPYGGGPPKLADLLNIELIEAEELFKVYENSFPTLNKYLKDQFSLGIRQGFIRIANPHNGIRWFPKIEEARKLRELEDKDWKSILSLEGKCGRDAMNTPIQGTGAAIVKEAMVETRKLLKEYNGYMLLQVHDEICFEIKNDQIDKFKEEAEKIMIECGNKYVTKVNMEVESSISDKWNK